MRWGNSLFRYFNNKLYIKNKDLQKIFNLPGDIRFVSLEINSDIHTFVGISSNIKCYDRAVICIKEDNKIYKVISVSASKDGSLNIFFHTVKKKMHILFSILINIGQENQLLKILK